MRSESRIFNGIALFLFVMAAVYGLWTSQVSTGSAAGLEWVGVVALILSGLLCLMCGGYFSFVARRIEPRPEDRADAEISEGAGDLGFFSPGSYWPITLAGAAALAGLGIVFWAPWLMAIGAVAIIGSVGGLLFEYYTGSHAQH
ncbi:MAG TPA: cytochrome c oxidase subunit 4 [Mycobacteriales bacterium]|jgi:hypothetical protein